MLLYRGRAFGAKGEGYIPTIKVESKTPDELLDSTNYSDWEDFNSIWNITEDGISLNVQVENIPDNIILVATDANTEGTYTLGQYTGIIGENVFDDIQDAVNNADEGSTIIVAPGEYNGNILFGGKSLTIQAQYLAYKDGVKETDESKLSKFTGTFNAYGDTAESFYADQKIVIDGFALSGDGLKIGNNNYNSVGNLEVRHCTMTFGKNLTNPSDNSYAGLNYFVKVNGNNGTPYATVTVENNYVSGTPNPNVYPIQLWDVEKTVVKNNTIILEKAENHQTISISKTAENATVEITKNEITGAGGGVYVTTWLLCGDNTEENTFAGIIDVKDNTITCAESDIYPIFLGYAEVEDVPYGQLGGKLTVEQNIDGDGVPVEVVFDIKENDEATDPVVIFATFKDDEKAIATCGQASNKGTITITMPDALEKTGYTFLGWKYGNKTARAGDEVTISEDTVFEA